MSIANNPILRASMGWSWLLVAIAGGSKFISVSAFPLNATSHVQIYIPTHLHKDTPNGIPHTMSNFGQHPQYGSLVLPVYFYFQLCETPVDTSKGYPPRRKDAANGSMRWEPPFILMTPRGDCSFTTKARHAQMAGASAIVIADTTCLCSDQNCVQNNTWRDPGTCEEHPPAMADDGSGGDVTIPGFLLHKDDAVPIKEAIVDKGQSALMSLRWHKPQNDSVHFGTWIDILDDHSKLLLHDTIGPVANALGERGYFYPHYMLHNGTRTNCGGESSGGTGNETQGLCYNMCTNNGRYCYPTHRNNGTAVVLEILRRSCIWKHHGQTKGDIGRKWWDYVSYFDTNCQTYTDDKCIHEAYNNAGIKKEEIDNCFTDTGDPTGDDPNSLLDAALRAQIEYGVTIAPTLWVNHRILKDPAASPGSFLRSICDLNAPESEFKVCRQCLHDQDPMECVIKKYGNASNSSRKKHSKTFHVWLWTGFLASIWLFAYAYKRYQEGEGASFPGLQPMAYAMLRDGEDHGFESTTT